MEIYERSNLTKAQLVFWLGQKLHPGLPLYNNGLGLVIPMRLEPEHFRRAFSHLVCGSDALRTVIEVRDGVPQQRVSDAAPYTMDVVDFSSATDPMAAFDAWAEERIQKVLEFGERLFDSALVKLADDKFVWYLNQHHVICDAFSFLVIIHYTAELYQRSLAGTLEDAPALPAFRDYVEHELGHRGESGNAEEAAYWARKLSDKPEHASFYGTSASRQAGRIRQVYVDLGVERTQRIRALAVREDVATKTPFATNFNIFAAAFMAYQYRMNGTRQPAVGMPFHNRRAGAFKRTVGIFIGVLPLSVAIEDGDTPLTLIRRIAKEASERLRNSAYYFHNLLHLHSHDVLVNYLLWSFPDFCGSPCEIKWIHPGWGLDPLVLNFYENPFTDSYGIVFDFNCSLFDEESQDLTTQHMVRTLDQLLKNPELPLEAIDLLTADERQRLTVDFNRTERDYPKDTAIHRIFEAQATRTPDATAIRFGKQNLSYAELNQRANRIARFLRAVGAGSETMVGLCLERSVDMVAGLLGILKAGGAYVPLDPAYPPERLAFMIRDAQVPLLLTQVSLLPLAPEGDVRIICLDRDWDSIARHAADDLEFSPAPEHLAYVIYTSGSTGRPKGALLEHRGLCNLVEAQTHAFGVTEDSRVLQFASMSFDASVSEVFMALCTGATLCLARQETLAAADDLARLLREERITTVTLPPSILKVLPASEFPDLRTVIAAGERCTASVVNQWAPGRAFFNAYGPTETTVCASIAMCEAPVDHDPPIGRPMANMQLYVLDQEMRAVPVGVPGELYIGGAGLARGYWNRPELTEERFVANPFSGEAGARLYRTGDRVRYTMRGDIEFLGRADHQVKVRGFRIELGEIESLMQQHPDLADSVVVAREDVPEDHRLVAYVVPRRNGKSFNGELKAYLRQFLPEYMVPSAIVVMDALPLSPNGKVDRRALPQPDRTSRDVVGAVQTARDALELELTHIWEHVLDVHPISVTDNFFDLGGHSLSAVTLMDEIQGRLGQRLSPAVLFELPTIELLAGVLRAKESAKPESVVVPIQPEGAKAPFFCVHPAPGTVFCYVPIAQHIEADRPFYGLQAPSINGVGVRFETIEETAAYYIEAMRAVRPEGPYHLGGHSSGGVVAFEMARQLRQEGHVVGSVVLLDTLAPLPGPRSADLYRLLLDASDDALWLASIMLMVEHFFNTRLTVTYGDLRQLTSEEQYLAVLNELKRVNFLAPSAGPGAIHGLVENCRESMKAGMRYCPEPYDGHVVYLHTDGLFAVVPEGSGGQSLRQLWALLKRDWRALLKGVPQLLRDMLVTSARSGVFRSWTGDRTLGWKSYVTGPIATYPVPGNHISMLADPAAAGVASRLQACLDMADQEQMVEEDVLV
ncbi:MAG: amino acid adenylation domain-containing protein [Candidatus Hydrogenedentes bacterium]|nr:amino acid adenylation domain-containing protein [Candidatus Hydrogenedentota bacterium]